MGPGGPVHRPACQPRNPDGPGRVGEPGLGPGLGLDAPDRRPGGRERVAEPPQGAGGALRANRQLLDHRVPAAMYGAERHPAADPVLADLERAESSEVLRAGAIAGQVRPPGADLPRRDHAPGIRRPGSCSPVCPGTGTWPPRPSSTTSTRCPGSRTSSTPPPCIRTRPPSNSQRLAIQRVRNVMTSRGDAATPLWLTELAWGSAPPDQLRPQQGPRGPERSMLTSAYRMILPEPHRLERAAPLLVPLAGP